VRRAAVTSRGSFAAAELSRGALQHSRPLSLPAEAVSLTVGWPGLAWRGVAWRGGARRGEVVLAVWGPAMSSGVAALAGWAGTVARPCLQSFRRLWVAVISRHSERQAPRPLRWTREAEVRRAVEQLRERVPEIPSPEASRRTSDSAARYGQRWISYPCAACAIVAEAARNPGGFMGKQIGGDQGRHTDVEVQPQRRATCVPKAAAA
jgi:hypothetical protein